MAATNPTMSATDFSLVRITGNAGILVGERRAPKRALKVFRLVEKSWRQLRKVRLISARRFDNLLTSAALREVTAAERFRRVLG
jgi:hypothetical protein